MHDGADDKAGRTAQDCSRCPMMRKCWGVGRPNNKDAAIAINLLVCRLKLGLERNRSTKVLLRMLRPKALRVAAGIREATGGGDDIMDLVAEVESVIIEVLLSDYQMGGRADVLKFLFGVPKGGVTTWARRRIRQTNKYNTRHYLYGIGSEDEDDHDDLEARLTQANAASTHGLVRSSPLLVLDDEPGDTDDETARAVEQALAVVDDGVTLNLNEYRVMRFCLTAADTMGGAPLTGLHGYVARVTGLRRDAVSLLYRQATQKLLEALHMGNDALEERGVHVVMSPERRVARLYGLDTNRLEPDEIWGLVQQNGGAGVADICWAYGVTRQTYHKLCGRYAGKTLDEIKEQYEQSR